MPKLRVHDFSVSLDGYGERLFDELGNVPTGYEIAEFVGTPAALHVRFVRKT